MFFTIDDVVSGKKYNVNIMWITSLKNGDDTKSAPNFDLLLYQGDGGRPLVERFATAEERRERRELILDAGSFFILDDVHYNIVWVQSIAKVNAGDPLYDGNLAQRPGTSITFANGRVLYGMFDTEVERDEFYDKLMETLISGGLVQKDTYDDFPKNGNPNCVYLAKDTGITFYWDKVLKTYVTTGSGGRKGVYQYDGILSATMGTQATLNKSDLREIVKATVDFMETSDVIDDEGTHAIIIDNGDDTVEVVTIADQTIDSFRQVLTLADLPATGKTNILFYVDDIDEFRTWDESVNDWIEPFHPLVINSNTAVADARVNTLYVDGTVAKYTTDNLSWTYLSSLFFEDPDIADALVDTLYINGTVAKYTKDNSEWIYLSSVFFENPDVADAITEALYIDGNIAKYTKDNLEWLYLTSEAVKYERGVDYHEGTLVYLDNVLTKTTGKFKSDILAPDLVGSFNYDIASGNLEVIVDAYTRTNNQYDLTGQVDGVTKIFDIPTAITNDRSLLVFYAGQLLVEGVNYSVDFINSKLTLNLEEPPSPSENKHLIIISGNIDPLPPKVRTVTGVDPYLVDNTDPLNPVVQHDKDKIDKSISDELVSDVSIEQDGVGLVITEDKVSTEDGTSSDKSLKVTSSDESILFNLKDEDGNKVLDIKSTHSNNVLFDISDQMDGENQEFDIDPSINTKKSMLVFYAGQMLVPGENYTVDYDKHILTTTLSEAPDTGEGRHLILIVGDIVAQAAVQTVTGEDDLVDNSDITNPVVRHDDTKLDKDSLDEVLTKASISKVGDDLVSDVESIKVSDGTKVNDKTTIISSNGSVKFEVKDIDSHNKQIDITSNGGNVYYDLTSQLDGLTQSFNISHDITERNTISVFYAGQLLTKYINYTIDTMSHQLITHLPEAPTSDEDRHLILIVGDMTAIDIASTGTIIYENPFVFDSITQEFNLPVDFDSTKPFVISVNGVMLSPGSDRDYTIVGNKVKFTVSFESESNSKIIYFK